MAQIFSKPKRETQQINLLPEREFSHTVSGRVLSWIISTFRVIVIVTEILVMIAFLSRFWLDAQNTDLTEELEQKVAVVGGSESFETEFKDVQKRIELYKNLSMNTPPTDDLAEVTKNLPQDVRLTELSKVENEIQIIGETANERSVQQLVVNLLATKRYASVSLQELGTNVINPNLLTFTIQVLGQSEKKEVTQ